MPDPRWRQIAEDLRAKIESGELGANREPLPSDQELRDIYGASRNTVRDALKWLVTRRLVTRRPGQGTFVLEKIDPFVTRLSTDINQVREAASFISLVAAQSREADVSRPRVDVTPAAPVISGLLKLGSDEEVVSRYQERFIDSTPFSLQTTFYPMRLVEQGADRLREPKPIAPGAVAYIEKTLGIRQAGFCDTFTVRPPEGPEAQFFELPDDGSVSIIEIIRTSYDESGRPLRVTITAYPGDRNQFLIIAGVVPEEEKIISTPVDIPVRTDERPGAS